MATERREKNYDLILVKSYNSKKQKEAKKTVHPTLVSMTNINVMLLILHAVHCNINHFSYFILRFCCCCYFDFHL